MWREKNEVTTKNKMFKIIKSIVVISSQEKKMKRGKKQRNLKFFIRLISYILGGRYLKMISGE